MEYILQTDNLSKVYGVKTVLNHVSIHVPKSQSMVWWEKTEQERPRYAYYLWLNAAKRRQLYIVREDK